MPWEIRYSSQVHPAKVTPRPLSLKLGTSTFEGACIRTLSGASSLARLRRKFFAFISTLVLDPSRPFERGAR